MTPTHAIVRTLAHALVGLVVGLGGLALAGCEDPQPLPEPCAGPGDPQLVLSNRRAPVDLGVGGQVEVFPPPQGGVFAELDLVVHDMAIDELDDLRVEVESVPAGEQLAYVRYFGDSIPLRCAEQDDGSEQIELTNLPVGFVESYTLDDLDGRTARVIGTLETVEGDFSVDYDVTLVRTDY
ncbi:MAG: hypothetical protein KDK70_12425 [Myxococcales bacterium]|nr:hypothetical protein [Myxococcales bacterium]